MTLTANDIVSAMRQTFIRIMDHVDYLNELDAKMGDGEHGSNMRKSFTLLNERLDGWNSSEKTSLLELIGKTLLSSGGGTATTLFGIFFMYAGTKAAVLGKDWDTASVAEIVRFAYDNLQKRSTAQVGDKTIIDALEPAVTTFLAMAHAGHTPSACLEAATQAAEKGAAATADIVAKKGRGVYMGERGLGTLDPGAVSVSLILRSWSDYCDKAQGHATSPNATFAAGN
jgi:dihydroxyacetone kinase-like protein